VGTGEYKNGKVSEVAVHENKLQRFRSTDLKPLNSISLHFETYIKGIDPFGRGCYRCFPEGRTCCKGKHGMKCG